MTTKGKVVLVPFPFDDLSTMKVRPAVCLTDPISPHGHIVVAFITSRVPVDPTESDIRLDVSLPGFDLTGLRISSTLRLHRMMTVARELILRELGELPDDLKAAVDRGLRSLFDLP